MLFKNHNKQNVVSKIVLVISIALATSTILSDTKFQPIDVSFEESPELVLSSQYRQHKMLELISDGKRNINRQLSNNFDQRLGLTTFSWYNNNKSTKTSAAKFNSSSVAGIAKNAKHQTLAASDFYLGKSAFQHGLTKSSIDQAKLRYISNNGKGAIIAKYRQKLDGIDVFNREINVMMNQQLEHIATAGYFSTSFIKPSESQFELTPNQAIVIAFQDMGGQLNESDLIESDMIDSSSLKSSSLNSSSVNSSSLNSSSVKSNGKGNFKTFNANQDKAAFTFQLKNDIRIKPVYFPMNTSVIPAYYTELLGSEVESTTLVAQSYVISAVDGKILFRNNLVSNDTTTYRVYADTTGDNIPKDSPTGNSPTPNASGAPGAITEVIGVADLITLDHGPISTNDPWLVSSTETTGNNVDAYADISAPDGFGGAGDIRASTTSANTFDYTPEFGVNATSDNARKAAVVNLFYVNNFLHDWFYDNGFDEASGNAQTDNYGRGGAPGDPLKVEAQDFSGLNNANMATPSDGGSPTMQMFLFDEGGLSSFTAAGLGSFTVAEAGFGAADFDVTADLVQLVDDNTTTDLDSNLTPDFNDGCDTITNAAALVGNIVLINRGNCNFDDKVKAAETAGGVGVIIINNDTSGTGNAVFTMGGDDTSITIGALMIGNNDGTTVLDAVALGTVNATMQKTQTFRDGTLDSGIVAHEWGHYLSNRLVVNSNGLSNQQGRGMGEGWSDFITLLMSVRESDKNLAGNDQFQGTYSAAGYAVIDYYFGIRRVPYSTDMTKNALTFKHIENGVPIIVSHPFAGSTTGGNNAEVHATGEVWASALWDAYTNLLNRPALTFAQAQDRMKSYLVAGLKMTPASPTFIEARDGILAAAAANDAADFELIFAAFAKRGMGFGAVAPNRSSASNSGVEESFVSSLNAFEFMSDTLNTSLSGNDNDNDGVLDVGDTGSYSISIKSKSGGALNGATALLSTSADITFSNGGVIAFNNLSAFDDTTSASLQMTLNSATTAELVTIDVTFPDPGIGMLTPDDYQITLNVNYDLTQTRSSDDIEDSILSSSDFNVTVSDAAQIPFTITSAAGIVNSISNTSQLWWGVDNSSPGTTALELPEVQVEASGDFILAFYHYFSFEVSADNTGNLVYWDGGVIEVSINGAPYQDVVTAGGVLSTPYNQTLSVGAMIVGGRDGFGGQGGDEVVTLTFPDGVLNGRTTKIRFLIGTDASVGALGWLIDDVSFSNVVTPPFSTLIVDGGTPGNAPPTVSVGASTTVNSGDVVSIPATANDAENDPLTYSWTQLNTPAVDISGSNSSATLTFTAPTVSASTDLVFQVIVNDGNSNSAPAQTTVTVEPPANTAPTVSVTASTTVTSGNAVSVSATGDDVDNDALTFLWTQTAGPNIDISSSSSTATLSFTAPSVTSTTTYSFNVMVNDGTVDSTAASTNVVVNPVAAPPPPPPPPPPTSSGGGGSTEGFVLTLLAYVVLRRQYKTRK